MSYGTNIGGSASFRFADPDLRRDDSMCGYVCHACPPQAGQHLNIIGKTDSETIRPDEQNDEECFLNIFCVR
jgi:hypothetical protein